jgi:nucleoid DNA-binding protein
MAARKKAAAKKAAPKATVGKKAPTKSEIFGIIAERTELSKRDVRNVFDSLTELAGRVLAKGAGQFTVPGLCKLVVKTTPARKARKGINPFTGEEMTFKAKPKSKTVRARAVKALKDSVV